MPKREGIRYSTKTYPICDSLLWRSARRSFALLQKPNEDWPALKTGNGDVQHESTWKARNGFPPSSRAHLVQPIPKEGVSAWELRPRSHWSPLNFLGLFFLHAIATISCGDTQLSPSFDWQISWSEDQCQRSVSLTTSSCQGNNNKHF